MPLQIEGGAVSNVGLLSVSMLLNGYSYFIPRLHELHQVPALVGVLPLMDVCLG